jgi:malate dehydrogenase (oxaloacetate-decarboxylating)
VNKTMAGIKVVVNGAGASGMAVTKLLMSAGMQNVILCDTTGAIYEGRPQGMNPYKDDMARKTNRDKVKGKLREAIRGADVFLGLSAANVVDADMVKSMAKDAIIFGMANPDPEIPPDIAKAAGARIVATGRSDYPNQINNVLGFPGIFRGALDVRARVINEPMKLAAAHAIAKLAEDDLRDDRIIVNPLHEEVIAVEAREVARVAMETGVARVKRDLDEIYRNTKILVQFARERYQMNDDFYRQCAGMAR